MNELNAGVSKQFKGARIAADWIDLVVLPILLGIVVGLALWNVGDALRSAILVVVNIMWLIFRDWVYSPGRAMYGVKLISLTGEKVTVGQAFLRNVLLVIPILLVVGYLVEIVLVHSKGNRLADGWAKTQVVSA